MSNLNITKELRDKLVKEYLKEMEVSSVIITWDGKIIPINSTVFQWYTKEHYESNTGHEITDDQWNRLLEADHKYGVLGDTMSHMQNMTEWIEQLDEEAEEDEEE
mgnify:CR=1 FL=1|tara:strand:+ start:1548 stop:1862 length:315 start_codon:yes stop_codon:yes gene_type:complete